MFSKKKHKSNSLPSSIFLIVNVLTPLMIRAADGSVLFNWPLWFLGFFFGLLRISIFTSVWFLQELHSQKK